MTELKPWDRQLNENSKAHRAFIIYRNLGPDRSLDAAWALHAGKKKGDKRASRVWQEWSSKFKWTARAQSWDLHQVRLKDDAFEKAQMSEAEKWAKRRTEVMEYEYGTAALLLQVAAAKLQTEKTLTNVATACEVATRMMRRACKLPVEVEEHPPDSFRDLFFETSGELAVALSNVAVPEMPADVGRKPKINTGRVEAGKDGAPTQPPKLFRGI